METFYITTPIYYINDVPHIGHAYCTIACDILARYKRLKGYDVFFLTGSDENSQKTVEAAKKAGKDIQAYTDEMSEIWKNTWKKLEITFSDFIRTTEERHKKAVLKLFQKIYQKGDIYKGKYKGLYCWKCEAFYRLSDLKEGKCPLHLTECEEIEEENYFFRLSRYQEPLLAHYQKHPDFILPEKRRNEVIRFVESGLEDISISRVGQKWGIPLPIDSRHVFYVWFDALINYISGIGYGETDELKYWPCDYHVLGRDITRFHCVIWPAMLMSAGLPLPKHLFVHGFFTIGGLKISKSLGNAIDPIPISERFGKDALRYYLFSEFPFGSDGDFSFETLATRINTELADDLGNLLSRTVSMTLKFTEGKLCTGEWVEEEDRELKETAEKIISHLDEWYSTFQYSKLLRETWKLFRLANKYAETQKPWSLAKDVGKKKRLAQVLYNLAEALRIGSYIIRPVMPETADKILAQLGLSEENYTQALEWGRIPEGTQVVKGDPLFPKIELKEGDPFFELGKKSKQETPKSEEVKKITFGDFQKLDLRVGKVTKAERIEKAKKLLKLEVDLGGETRQIVSGIFPSYQPEELVGKLVVLVANLAPRKIMGIESQGMLLAASEGEKVVILTLDREISPGAKVT